ncbi:hypothetical protein CN090_33400 [Sinorhizobium meliloti]|nr:hypothetical protein CN235_27285 [Sinorhizobium meliloti]RVE98971.1 hypothetical protein CN234_34750 [Sinorhizobium meliloti]RVG57065.1 hypothetical protein CN226_01990 [Sinorhizobium meliloti]RVG84150.1 hypothetical protein CN218_33440 [Sinorhizobium meliloti]RVH19291.1 hypothetical protein CN215_28660 [Sinorhizobium meliloti]
MNTTRPALIHTEEDQARQINAEAWNKVARDALPRRRVLPRHQVPQPVQSARTPSSCGHSLSPPFTIRKPFTLARRFPACLLLVCVRPAD